jgi:pSer/pThr/pTyr-binding forkhead associated (FHA) protein
MIKLNVTNRKTKAQKSYQLSQNTILFGRQSDCDVALEAHGVSRQHAKISLNHNLLEIEDLASGNGTIVNQIKLKPKEKTPIKNGDKIRIEEFEIEIVSQEAAKSISPPPSATLPPKPAVKPTRSSVVGTQHAVPAEKPVPEKEPAVAGEEFKESKFDITDPDIIEIKMIKKVLGALDPDKMPSLTVTSEPFSGTKVIFEEGQEEWVIGRDEDCDLSLNDAALSRRHATLSVKWGGYALTDLDSKNNTFVNGHKIKEATLKDGDEVVFGTIKTIFKNPQEFDIETITETLKEPAKTERPKISPPETKEKNTVSDAAKISTDKTEPKKDAPKDQKTKEKDAEKNKDDADGILNNIDKDEQKKSLPPPKKLPIKKMGKGLSVLEIIMMLFGVTVVGIVIASLWYLLR